MSAANRYSLRRSPSRLFPVFELDLPFARDDLGDEAHRRAPIGPLDGFGSFGGIGIEVVGAWRDPDSAEIEPVGIPACLDGHVGMAALVRVPCTGSTQELEFTIRELEDDSSELTSQLGGAGSVRRVVALIQALAVVQDREELDDLERGPGFGASKRPFSSTRAQCAIP